MTNRVHFEKPAHLIAARTRNLRDFLPIETAYFKTVFEARPGEKKVLKLFALSRYCLYVNGQMVNNGPLKGDRNQSYLDSVDISAFLRPGQNALLLKVTSFPPSEAYVYGRGETNVGPYGIMGAASGPQLLVIAQGDGADLSTGYAQWFVKNDEAIRYLEESPGFIMGGNEEVRAEKLPGNLFDADITGFEEAVTATVYDERRFSELMPFVLYERPLPLLTLEEDRFVRETPAQAENARRFGLLSGPVTLAPHGRYSVDLDAGVLKTAYLFLEMEGGLGARVNLTYAESYMRLSKGGAYPGPLKGKRDDWEHFDLLGLTDVVYPSGKKWTYQPFWIRTFRFVRLVVETGDQPLTLYPPRFLNTGYPLVNQVKIAPEQDWVKRIWEMSERTLRLCMHETHEDCPYYEQLQYILDTRLQMQFTYTLGGDTRMGRRTIFDFHASLLPDGILQSRYPCTMPQVIPCFALQWIGMLSDYLQQTGDLDLVRRYRPTMEAVLDWFKRKTGRSGLVENLGYWEFFDWPDQWGRGFGQPNAAVDEGVSTAENLVYVHFLKMAAALMEQLGHTQDAGFYRDEAQGIMDQVRKLCWDEERKMFREGPATREFSQHSQMYAVLDEMVEGEEAKALMLRALNEEDLVQCTFPLQFTLFRALEKAGLYEETERLWPLWKRLLDENVTTIPEVPGEHTRSDCHAWGAMMLYEYPAKILGVYPKEQGFKVIGIKPQGLFMGQAAGSVPTPMGEVKVCWRVENGEFELEAEWPQGARAAIELPGGQVVESDGGTFEGKVKL